MAASEITPKYDSTLGLIFRLNGLWAEVDIPAKTGDYNAWNNVLDRIYVNLLYRNDLKIKKDEHGVIINIELIEDDAKIYNFLNTQISKYKTLHQKVKGLTKKGTPKQQIARSFWYKSLMLKDIWLRKFMNELKLYIKESVKTPGSVMWGGKK